jgi:hypothetical protein
MKKKLSLNKKTLKNLKLKLKKVSDRKAAPLVLDYVALAPSNGSSCSS